MSIAGPAYGAVEPTECQLALIAVETPFPTYPTPEQARPYFAGTSYMHVFVEGSVSVEYVVTVSGEVSELRVTESTHRAIGPRRSYPERNFDGFLESNVLQTVMKWQYEPIEQPCVARASFVYVFSENE